MSPSLVRIVLLATLFTVAGCSVGSRKPKSSARIYAGEAPTMHYSDQPEVAGGALNVR